MTMTVTQIKDLVGGRWFEVTFEKADGTIRKMNCRVGVSKYVTGGRPLSPTVVGVFDRIKLRDNLKAGMRRFDAGHKAYRCFKPDSLIEIRVGGKTYDKDGNIIHSQYAN